MADRIVLDELVHILGFELSPGAHLKIQKIEQGLSSVARAAKWATAGLAAMGGGFLYWMERTTEHAAGIYRLSKVTGLATSQLQGFSWAVMKAGGNSAEALNDIEALQKSLNFAGIPGQYNQGLFMLLGPERLNGIKSAKDALVAIARAFEGMDPAAQAQWAEQLGLSGSTLLLVQQGAAAVEKHMAAAPKLTKAQTKAAFDLQIQWEALKRRMTVLGQEVATRLAPTFERLLKLMERWFVKNKEWFGPKIEQVIRGISEGFRRFGQTADQTLSALIPRFRSFFDATDTSKAGEKSLASTVYWGLLAAGAATLLNSLSSVVSLLGVGGGWGIAIAAAVVAGGTLIANWDKIKKWAEVNWPKTYEVIKATVDKIVAVYDLFKPQSDEAAKAHQAKMEEEGAANRREAVDFFRTISQWWRTLYSPEQFKALFGPQTTQDSSNQSKMWPVSPGPVGNNITVNVTAPPGSNPAVFGGAIGQSIQHALAVPSGAGQ